MKLALIALGLLATTGVVYAACVFCWRQPFWPVGLALGATAAPPGL